ncbi:hypothetical protein A2U01_0093069, partial [Trifolium medium]|nr:hypothetical protein [Trifolium medium]
CVRWVVLYGFAPSFWLEVLFWAFGLPPRRRSEAGYGLG